MRMKIPHNPYTTLGIAASSSTRNATGCRNHLGENSVRKIATPSASGTAISSASTDDASVPKIIGAAPYTSATGSHVEVQRNDGPNRRSAGSELTNNTPRITRSRDGNARAKLVSAPETYRRLTDCPSRRCNGIVTTNGAPPDACKSAPGGGPYVSESKLLCGFPDRSPAGRDALQAGFNPGVQLFGQRRIAQLRRFRLDRKSTRLNSSHSS